MITNISKEAINEFRELIANDFGKEFLPNQPNNFTGKKADFSNTHFGSGNLSFLKAEFGDFPVSFKGTSYSEGNNNFQYAKFKNGKVTQELDIYKTDKKKFIKF